MPLAQRTDSHSVIDELKINPRRFEFVQTVRILQHYLKQSKGIPTKRSLGENIRFTASLSLAFPQTEVEALVFPKGTTPDSNEFIAFRSTLPPATEHFYVRPALIGLTGPLGAMPYLYTQTVLGRAISHKDQAVSGFFDLFNNRLTSLYVEASTRYNLQIQYELEPSQQYLNHIHALAGYKTKTDLHDDDGLLEEVYAAFSGLIRAEGMSAESLKQVIAGYFKLPTVVEQFKLEWFTIPKEYQNKLGLGSSRLGVDLMMGERTLQCDSRFEIVLGPVNRTIYAELLPEGKMMQGIKQLLRDCYGKNGIIDFKVILDKDAVEPAILSSTNSLPLGRGMFLMTNAVLQHSEDTVFSLHY